MMVDPKPLSRRDLAVLFALSLTVRGATAIAFDNPAYFVRWTMPEPCVPFALVVVGMATLLVVQARGRIFVTLGAGALAALAHLARADGLLLVPLGIALIARDRARDGAARLLRAVSF